MMPVQGGIRKRRTTSPKMSGTNLEYSSTQSAYPVPTAGGYTGLIRNYVPGSAQSLSNPIGPEIVSSYCTGKFLPGTRARWEPSVSFNTTGRVFCGFCDNPEVSVQIDALFAAALTTGTNTDWNIYLNAIKGLGDMRSFPVWQETEVIVPTKLRRKMFDCNFTVSTIDVNVLDRSMQTTLFIGIEGLNTTGNPGGFWFHDKVQVEGLHARVT